jgi:hypothetical protein
MARGFGDVLRGLGSVLNPQVAQELGAEDRQQAQAAQQMGMLGLQQRFQQAQEQRAQQRLEASPQYQAQLEALKNEKLFREEVAGAGGDMTKVASAAVKYGKPELAINLFNQQEQRAARAQQAAEAVETRRLQLTQAHEANLQRIADGKERQAEIARHNKAMEALTAQGHQARQEALNLGHSVRLLQLELAGNKAEVEKLRRVDTETTRLSAALEKANLPEADAVLGQVEKALEVAPKVAEYISGPKSLLPDLAVPDEVKFARQAFQKLFNITLKNRSGAAVTLPELDRLKQEFATGAFKTPQQLTAAVGQARAIINKHYASVASGFAPGVLGSYNERVRQFGGRVVLEAPKSGPAGASGGWSIEEVK